MNPSSNSFSKDTPTASSNTFSQDTPTASTNSFAKDVPEHGTLAWEGDNLTSGASPGDMISGGPPGVDEFGGIAHFKGRTSPSVQH